MDAASFSSIYTGRWPLIHQAGLADGGEPSEERVFLPPVSDLPILAETLQAAGIRTVAVVNNPFLVPSFGLARGFDVYDFDAGAGDEAYRSAEEAVQRALELLDDVDGQPFFLVVHLMDPHMDYSAPPPFRHSFTASIPSTRTLPVAGNLGSHLPPEDIEFVKASYDEEIAYVDQQLGVLRDGLSARGLHEQSMIIFTADHGEEFFEHGDFEHGHHFWQELLHVPLVVWAPGVEPGRESASVSLVDIAPTVLDWLGLQLPIPLDGISLWPNLSAVVPLPPRPLFAEAQSHGSPRSAVVHWPQKIIVNHMDGLIDVFDLVRDPHERTPRAGNAGENPHPLIADLCRHQHSAQVFDRSTDRAPARPAQDVLERLRSLGYLRVTTDVAPLLRDRQFPCYADEGWGAVVSVRWVDTLETIQRTALEQSLGLERAEHDTGTTWRYRVPDASPERLRAIVAHDMVEDTSGFDRASLELNAPSAK